VRPAPATTHLPAHVPASAQRIPTRELAAQQPAAPVPPTQPLRRVCGQTAASGEPCMLLHPHWGSYHLPVPRRRPLQVRGQ